MIQRHKENKKATEDTKPLDWTYCMEENNRKNNSTVYLRPPPPPIPLKGHTEKYELSEEIRNNPGTVQTSLGQYTSYNIPTFLYNDSLCCLQIENCVQSIQTPVGQKNLW